VNVLFDNEPTAEDLVRLAGDAKNCFPDGKIGETGLRKYAWEYSTTSSPIKVPPTGWTLDGVNWETDCGATGCWVLDVTYTTGGPSTFNAFYLPNAVGDQTLSTDFVYSTNVLNTLNEANFPCRIGNDYTDSDGNVESLPDEATVCCLSWNYTKRTDSDIAGVNGGFPFDFRPTENFYMWATSFTNDQLCSKDNFPTIIDRANFIESQGNILDFPESQELPHPFLNGAFVGMSNSPGVMKTTTIDPFLYQYKATIKLDEVELRTKAGILSGTVGVEHTVDTFLGFANFNPTGIAVLDSLATQAAIHLENTNLFVVSTHGTNDYTFLQYVNLRLVQVLIEDADFSGQNESAIDTVRTATADNAAYLQVTFTLGSKYSPNTLSGGLIPLDSVRAGRSQFFDDSAMEHLCSAYTNDSVKLIGLTGLTGAKDTFDDRIGQGCGPKASMCQSPTALPDNFVSFNIPLGFEVFDGQASASLSTSIFVHMVINAVDDVAKDAGTTPSQMKTTLSASIPIVDGGFNIFCDGVTSKTDLKDVADADIIVGSANSFDELSRIPLFSNIANTNLDAVSSTLIDTVSIEAGLMTLVLKGDAEYFTNAGNTNTGGYALELDDLITIHLMTDGVAPDGETGSVDEALQELLSQVSEDNSDSNGLDTNGYKLNGAFYFNIDRAAGIAELEPTPELVNICPFNPLPPAGGTAPMESCITRRDVKSRSYPMRLGAVPMAMEILAQQGQLVAPDDLTDEKTALAAQKSGSCTCTGSSCCEAGFLENILGSGDYTRNLAVDFVMAIDQKYSLNGRWTRAYWINPGYEWTAMQTNGKSIFSVSQKVYLFALITLDENIGTRRRMLLQSGTGRDTGTGQTAAKLDFVNVDRKSIMAIAFGVPAENIAQLSVETRLTAQEACLSNSELQNKLRGTFSDFMTTAASAHETVQVLGFTKSMNDFECKRRTVKGRHLLAFSDATAIVQLMVVFSNTEPPTYNLDALRNMPGIIDVQPVGSSVVQNKKDVVFIPDSKDEGGSSNTAALVGGVVGGVCGLLFLAAGAWYFMKSRSGEPDIVTAESYNLADLKHQLQETA